MAGMKCVVECEINQEENGEYVSGTLHILVLKCFVQGG